MCALHIYIYIYTYYQYFNSHALIMHVHTCMHTSACMHTHTHAHAHPHPHTNAGTSPLNTKPKFIIKQAFNIHCFLSTAVMRTCTCWDARILHLEVFGHQRARVSKQSISSNNIASGLEETSRGKHAHVSDINARHCGSLTRLPTGGAGGGLVEARSQQRQRWQ